MNRKGICINVGNCKSADANRIIELSVTADFVCPECGRELKPVIKKKIFTKRLIFLIIAVVVLSGIVAGVIMYQRYSRLKAAQELLAESFKAKEVVTEPVAASNASATTSEATTTETEPVSQTPQYTEDDLRTNLQSLANEKNDEDARQNLANAMLSNFFASPEAKITVFAPDRKTVLEKQTAQKFLNWLALAYKVSDCKIISTKRSEAGLFTEVALQVVYKK